MRRTGKQSIYHSNQTASILIRQQWLPPYFPHDRFTLNKGLHLLHSALGLFLKCENTKDILFSFLGLASNIYAYVLISCKEESARPSPDSKWHANDISPALNQSRPFYFHATNKSSLCDRKHLSLDISIVHLAALACAIPWLCCDKTSSLVCHSLPVTRPREAMY